MLLEENKTVSLYLKVYNVYNIIIMIIYRTRYYADAERSILEKNIVLLEYLKGEDESLYRKVDSILTGPEGSDFFTLNPRTKRYPFEDVSVIDYLLSVDKKTGATVANIAGKNAKTLETPSVPNKGNITLFELGKSLEWNDPDVPGYQRDLRERIEKIDEKIKAKKKGYDLMSRDTHIAHAKSELKEIYRDEIEKNVKAAERDFYGHVLGRGRMKPIPTGAGSTLKEDLVKWVKKNPVKSGIIGVGTVGLLTAAGIGLHNGINRDNMADNQINPYRFDRYKSRFEINR
jgi:hypothetical protein